MKAAEVALTNEERTTLQSWLAAGKTERRMAFRAAVILAAGLSNEAMAGTVEDAPRDRQQMAGSLCARRHGRSGGCRAANQPTTGSSTSGGYWIRSDYSDSRQPVPPSPAMAAPRVRNSRETPQEALLARHVERELALKNDFSMHRDRQSGLQSGINPHRLAFDGACKIIL
jgi:hypothetical protein